MRFGGSVIRLCCYLGRSVGVDDEAVTKLGYRRAFSFSLFIGRRCITACGHDGLRRDRDNVRGKVCRYVGFRGEGFS